MAIRPFLTYVAAYRLTARPYALSKAIPANTAQQYAVLYHPVTSLKLVRLKKVTVFLKDNSAAATLMMELRRLSGVTPPSGGTVITPIAHLPGSTAADSLCLALPTTPGSEFAPNGGWGTREFAITNTTAGNTVNPPVTPAPIVLYDHPADADADAPLLRAVTAEGFAVIIDANAATTVTATVEFIFTEET